MSAQQTYSKPPVNWPNLPPEVWTLIFRHATLVPDLISPDLCNYGKSDAIIRKQRKSYKQSLVTKRYLIRVCKAWYSGAIRFLYESILLGRGRVLASLCEALKRSHRILAEELPLGWWTKRIDIVMRDSTDDPNRDMALVGDIVMMLPNLSILIFDITGHRYDPGPKPTHLDVFPSSILRSTPPDNLNVVYYYSDRVVPPPEIWLEFLISRPHLRSISDISPRGVTGNPHSPVIVADFPSLTSLHLSFHWTIDYFSYSELPNLQHLTYHVDESIHTFWFPRLFQKHGTKLRSLTMDSFISRDLFDVISETCSNLVSLELTINDWTSLSTHISTLPPVNLIKLACRKPHSKRAVYTRLFGFIARAKVMCPTLNTVRFIDEQNVSGLRLHPRLLQHQLKVLSAVGVALEDAEGVLLHPG